LGLGLVALGVEVLAGVGVLGLAEAEGFGPPVVPPVPAGGVLQPLRMRAAAKAMLKWDVFFIMSSPYFAFSALPRLSDLARG